jgi:hypothetical protein
MQSGQGLDTIESIEKVDSAKSDPIESIEHAESQEGELAKGSYVTWVLLYLAWDKSGI